MSAENKPVIIWFRQDLRLRDNPALRAACDTGAPILPVYVLDDENSGEWRMGGASRWWLHQSLRCLNNSLNGKIYFAKGDARQILTKLVKDTNAAGIYWNRCYEPWRIARDKKIKADLNVKSYNGSTLFEPHKTLKDDGTPYRVFTPFYKKGCLGKSPEPRKPDPMPDNLSLYDHSGLSLDDLGLMPSIKWYADMEKAWQPGEQGAQSRLKEFLSGGISGYKEGRNYPAQQNVSRLSPHLHFGEISPNDVWHAAKATMVAEGCEQDGETFLSELGWREFSHNLLYHTPDLPRKNLQNKFDRFPWRDDDKALKAWQTGQTGYPVIDAGMRELWQTGYMHNRVRMIVGSFLVKNLLLHWHHGEDWFWDTLVDADLANNSASWQWIAGCGADAAPYFRIFNPVTQSQKFDQSGAYIRRFVPELKDIPDEYIHAPWEAPDNIKSKTNYPAPIVDLKETRERALAAYGMIKG